MINMAFDMLNSRNPHAKGYKSPVSHENMKLWSKQCEKLIAYLLSLKEMVPSLEIGGEKQLYGDLYLA